MFSDLNCSSIDANKTLRDLFNRYKVSYLKDNEASFTRIGASKNSYIDYFLTVGISDH